MCQDVEDVAGRRIDDGQAMYAAVDENFDGIVEGGIRPDADQRHHLVVQNTWQRKQVS